MRRPYRAWLRWAVVFAAGAALVVTGAAVYLPCPATATIEAVPAALVLSGDVDYARAGRAAELQREGRVTFILTTGAGVGGDNADELARRAVERGADAARILTEPRSTTTRENFVFAIPIIRQRGWRRVALVTTRLHMFRALHTARRVAPDVEWLPVPVPDMATMPQLRRHRLAEWRKIAGYALRGWLA
jgi:uncharacterized SAM-binding protein YcdF (DUF218 family)